MMGGGYLRLLISRPPWLHEVPAIASLCRIWIQIYWWDGTQIQLREADNIPPAARFLSSPYDPEAHYARKHTTQWVGYKVHLTETCEDDLPYLITHIETTPGLTADGAATPQIHATLEQRGLLPGTHIVDTGFLDADLLVKSRDDYGVDLLGPTRLDNHWQAKPARAPVLTSSMSRSIGTSNTRAVRRAERVSAGRLPWTIAGRRSSR
jgi:transposase